MGETIHRFPRTSICISPSLGSRRTSELPDLKTFAITYIQDIQPGGAVSLHKTATKRCAGTHSVSSLPLQFLF
jgi:hypothetical protein